MPSPGTRGGTGRRTRTCASSDCCSHWWRRSSCRADSDIKTVADLKGKAMTDGYTAQNTILPQLSAIYATAGMTRDDVQQVSVASVVAGCGCLHGR